MLTRAEATRLRELRVLWWRWWRVSVSADAYRVYATRHSPWGWPTRSVCVLMEEYPRVSPLSLAEVAVAMAIAKRERAEPGASRAASAEDAALAKKHPHLHEYMTSTRYEDGAARQTSSVLIFVQDGLWKAMLKDRDANETLWATGDTMAAAVASLDAMLGSGKGEWRAERPREGGGSASRRRAS